MNEKNRKSKIIAFLALLFISVIALLLHSTYLEFIISIVLLILIICNAKFSFFSELSFILWFSYLQGFLREIIGSISGSTLAFVGITMPYYYNDLAISIISFLLTVLFFCWFTKIIQREKRYYITDCNLNRITAIVFIICALLLIILVFPSMPTLTYASGSRARNENVSYGLVMIALVLLGICLDSCKNHKWFYGVYSFAIIWIFGHGERVELLGLLSYIALRYLNRIDYSSIKNSIKKHKKRLVYTGVILAVIFAAIVGFKRNDSGSTITIKYFLTNLFIQGTAGDTVYDFNCSADMWHTGEGLYGITYIDYLLQLIPGASTSYTPAEILFKEYNTMGGSLFFGEAMMNFGIVGVIIFNVIFMAFFNSFLNSTKHIKGWMWIPVVIEVFRICWYGIDGWILAAFIEVPILYFCSRLVIGKKCT